MKINEFKYYVRSSTGGGKNLQVGGKVGPVAISADLRSVVSADSLGDNETRIAVRNTIGQIEQAFSCQGQVSAVAINAQGRLVVGGIVAPSGESTLRLWQVDGGDPVWQINTTAPPDVLCFSPDGALIAVGGLRLNTLELRQTSDGALFEIALLPAGYEGVSALAFSHNGEQLAAGGINSNRIHLFQLKSGYTLTQTLEAEEPVCALALSAVRTGGCSLQAVRPADASRYAENEPHFCGSFSGRLRGLTVGQNRPFWRALPGIHASV